MTQHVEEQIAWLEKAISQLEMELVAIEAEVQELREEIALFELDYNRLVQPVIQRIEAVKEAIREVEALQKKRQIGDAPPLEALWRAAAGRTPPPPAEDAQPLPAPPPASTNNNDNNRLKQLYYQLARRYHPDFAIDEEDRRRRNEMMLLINEAYAKRDWQALKQLDYDIKSAQRDASKPTHQPYQQVRLRTLRERYHQLAEQVEDMKIERAMLLQSDMMELKLKTSLARARGRDLLKELAQELEEEYWDWIRKLDALRSA